MWIYVNVYNGNEDEGYHLYMLHSLTSISCQCNHSWSWSYGGYMIFWLALVRVVDKPPECHWLSHSHSTHHRFGRRSRKMNKPFEGKYTNLVITMCLVLRPPRMIYGDARSSDLHSTVNFHSFNFFSVLLFVHRICDKNNEYTIHFLCFALNYGVILFWTWGGPKSDMADGLME